MSARYGPFRPLWAVMALPWHQPFALGTFSMLSKKEYVVFGSTAASLLQHGIIWQN